MPRCIRWLSVALALVLAPTLTLSFQDPAKDPPKKEEAKKDEPKKEQPKSDQPFDSTPDDIKALKEVGVQPEGPAILEYFRKRTFKEADPKSVDALVKQLGDEDFEVREKAFGALLHLGPSAMVGIKQAENDADTEVKRRALEIKSRIEAKADPTVQSAAARMLGRTKPEGTAEVLLAYLPFADPMVIDDICKALGANAVRNGKVEQCIVQSLEDKLALKRGAAGEAVARANAKDELPAARKLLKDSDPRVRLRVGLAMLPYKEKETLAVLVELLQHLEPQQLWPVEEVLVRLAGDKTPPVSLGTSEATRKVAHEAWKKWFDASIKDIDLAKLQQPEALLGYTLVMCQNINRIVGGRRIVQMGQVIELDHNKKERWKFNVNTFPVDGQVVGPDRVLLAEYHAGRVTERDFKGNVTWEKQVGGNPIGVQRLPNGNTFIVMQNRLVEMDRNGNEAFSYNRQNSDIFRAKKLRSGEVCFITNGGQFTRMEAQTQKVIKQFQVGQVPVLFGSMDLLPDGGVVFPDFQQNRVVEFDANGAQKMTFNVPTPNGVQRLPTGNYLVTSQNQRRVAEYDRGGREIWNWTTAEYMPFNAHKR